jgi:hypothetical protein
MPPTRRPSRKGLIRPAESVRESRVIMVEQPSLIKNVLKKGIAGLVIGGVLMGTSIALNFPVVFQWMFFAYAMLGTTVFILLDAPSIKPIGGVKAVLGLLVFYAVLSVAYITGASLWPQYDPEDTSGIQIYVRASLIIQ